MTKNENTVSKKPTRRSPKKTNKVEKAVNTEIKYDVLIDFTQAYKDRDAQIVATPEVEPATKNKEEVAPKRSFWKRFLSFGRK